MIEVTGEIVNLKDMHIFYLLMVIFSFLVSKVTEINGRQARDSAPVADCTTHASRAEFSWSEALTCIQGWI